MQWRDDPKRWGLVTRLLHWLLAAALLFMLALGLWMVRLDYYHPLYQRLPEIHRGLGVLLALPLLFRLFWRLCNPRPRLLAGRLEQFLARTVQALLLILPILMVVSGYLISTADGKPVEVFGWFRVPAPGLEIDNLEDKAGRVHAWLGYLLIGLVLLHVAGALKHQFLDRDEILIRMLGGGAK